MSEFEIDKRIEAFINNERATKPTPFLATRVMAKIEGQQVEKVWHIKPVWATLAISTALAGIVLAGVTLGKTYSPANGVAKSLLIDDTQIENLSYYSAIIPEEYGK